VDTSVKKLLEKRSELELLKFRLERKIKSIDTALALIDVTPNQHNPALGAEADYLRAKPFQAMPLKQACGKILRDNAGEWLTKTEVEHLLQCGGYESTARDRANSVEVTLRRLADHDFCDVRRLRGPKGNQYSVQLLDLKPEQPKSGRGLRAQQGQNAKPIGGPAEPATAPVHPEEQATATTVPVHENLWAMSLDELRRARQMTQGRVAEAMGNHQSDVSRIERGKDPCVSTLSEYVEALGGRLEIRAVFPGREVRINQFEGLPK
jgi:Helix-turn-helix domain